MALYYFTAEIPANITVEASSEIEARNKLNTIPREEWDVTFDDINLYAHVVDVDEEA